jgi:transposase
MSGDRTIPRQIEIVASTRRHWSAEQKLAMVSEIAAGSSVSQVARRHGVHASQLFRWRRDQAPAAPPKFLPVRLPPPPHTEANPPTRTGSIEIAIAGGRTVRVDTDVDTVGLVRIIAALEGCR